MKQYVVDELRPGDHEALKAYLDENLALAGLDGLYWKSIDNTLLTDEQAAHAQCTPLYFALVLTPESLSCELLLRTRNRIRCDCMAYATIEQRNWIVGWIDTVFNELGIIA
jgi:hypothetical protein